MITTLTISVVWIVYSMIPPYLLIHYTWIGRGTTLQFMCRVAFVLSFVTSICAMLLLWLVYPKDYDFGSATKVGGARPLICVCLCVAVTMLVVCSPSAVLCDGYAVSVSRPMPCMRSCMRPCFARKCLGVFNCAQLSSWHEWLLN